MSQSEAAIVREGVYDAARKSSLLPHKTIALMTGLGWIGKNNLLVTEPFGCALCMCSVLADIPVKAISLIPHVSRCGDCLTCQNICPPGVITGKGWTPQTPRDEIVDVQKCTTCLQCMIHCPWTQKYMNGCVGAEEKGI